MTYLGHQQPLLRRDELRHNAAAADARVHFAAAAAAHAAPRRGVSLLQALQAR